MHAVRIHTTGSTNVMAFEEAPMPVPAENEILIQARAASVNPVDAKVRAGTFRADTVKFPVVLGRDVSGIVAQCGSEVRRFEVGDEVYAALGAHPGGYAEYALATESECARKPHCLDHVHAAAVPLAALTAWQGLFEHGRLQTGETALIHGAGGGVGHFAVQFAKQAGARVLATAAAEDLELVSSLGAAIVVDFRAMAFQDIIRDVDLVLDLVGGEAQARSWAVLREQGVLVSALGEPSRPSHAPAGSRGVGFMVRPDSGQLQQIAALIDDGRVSVVVSKVKPLSQARHAHEELESEHTQGKTVLTIA